MPYCFAPECNHVSRRETCRFYRFPTDQNRFKKWRDLCRRQDREPNKEDRLCSCHFVDGKNNKETGPSIFKHNEDKINQFPSPEKRKRVRKTVADIAIPGPSSAPDLPTETPSELTSPLSRTFGDDLRSVQMYFLEQENKKLKDKLNKGENRMTFDNIKDVDYLVFQYTGLPTAAHFEVLVKLIKRFDINYFLGWRVEVINLQDQLLCTLMKLRLNLLYFDLGFRFKISTTTVQNIVLTFIYVLHEILFVGMMDKIPSREKCNFFLPSCFASLPDTRVVLDCTEIEVAIPSSMREQKAVFSHYKQRHTFKVLIGIAPNATITYVSELFPGSCSDKFITRNSGILSHLLAGDLIVCDKGFLITDLCKPIGVHVNIPPFLNTPQFSKEEVLATRQIARARIHVERAISRLKSFKILDFIMPNMREHATKIVQTCAALINMQYSLLKENEQCFNSQ